MREGDRWGERESLGEWGGGEAERQEEGNFRGETGRGISDREKDTVSLREGN